MALEEIEDESGLIFNKEFIMVIFQGILYDLSPNLKKILDPHVPT